MPENTWVSLGFQVSGGQRVFVTLDEADVETRISSGWNELYVFPITYLANGIKPPTLHLELTGDHVFYPIFGGDQTWIHIYPYLANG